MQLASTIALPGRSWPIDLAGVRRTASIFRRRFEISLLRGGDCGASKDRIWTGPIEDIVRAARSSLFPAAVPVALQTLGKLRFRYRSEPDDAAECITAA